MNLSTPLFEGQLIRLTAVRNEDLPTLVRWYQESGFARHFDSSPAYPRGEERLRSFVTESRNNDAYNFAIRLLYSDELVGLVDLDGIQWNNRSAWLAIAIGEANQRGRGYGREAMQLILHFAFRELNLHRVQLTVFSYNVRAIRLYESLGFVHEGTYREAIHREGEKYDTLLYGMLVHEWAAGLSGS
ncbi:MAG: GNAT family protein [Anaerolineae bacterium]